jgi:hypothetical protein
MSFLSNLVPINLNEEKEKFFADNSYNPQFLYAEDIDQKKLKQYGKPSKEYLDLAKKILKKTYFGRNEQDLYMMKGKEVSQFEAEKTIHTFLHMHGLQNRYKTIWSQSFVVRTTIDEDTIKLRLPVDYRKEDLLGMLYHEVGTHALRRINYEQQPWFKRKKKYGFSSYLKTEEGLATIHSLIPQSFKSAFVPAIRYVAVEAAQKGSFVDVWNSLEKYVQDPERRWRIAYREKRGLEDTSVVGGYSKDLVYFEGFVDMYRWLEKHDFDLTNIYFGKLAARDIKKAIELNPDFKPQLPSFFSLSPETYAKEVQKIGKFNGL